MAGLNNKIPTDGLTTPSPKAMPMILLYDEERDVWKRALNGPDAALRIVTRGVGKEDRWRQHEMGASTRNPAVH